MSEERGSSTLESVFAIVLLMLLALGTMQVSFLLYARNVVRSSAHEAARVAIERGADDSEARTTAVRMVEGAVGGMVGDVHSHLERDHSMGRRSVVVVVRTVIRPAGPIPIQVPIRSTARLSGPSAPL